MKKICAGCGIEKPLEQFVRVLQKYRNRCKSCWVEYIATWRMKNPERSKEILKQARLRNPRNYKNSMLKHLYGISLIDYEVMLMKQGGGCAGCRAAPAPGSYLHVDHCHDTGIVRGLLCSPCNLAVGGLKNDPETMRRLANYLDRSLGIVADPNEAREPLTVEFH